MKSEVPPHDSYGDQIRCRIDLLRRDLAAFKHRTVESAGPVEDTVAAIERTLNEIAELADGAAEEARRLIEQAGIDDLTGLMNRRALERELSRAISFAGRYQTPIGLMFIDIDGFKSINDRFGHAGGDRVLAEFAAFLRTGIRKSDVVARYGGDEFVALLFHANADQCAEKARVLEAGVAETSFAIGDQALTLAATIGSTQLRENDTAAEVLARADADMYARK